MHEMVLSQFARNQRGSPVLSNSGKVASRTVGARMAETSSPSGEIDVDQTSVRSKLFPFANHDLCPGSRAVSINSSTSRSSDSFNPIEFAVL
jgi:hypothetical protein